MSMVDKVAEAIMNVPQEEKLSDYYAMARAAIEAMREPSQAMIDAAATVDRYADPGEEWEPMINAALGKVDA